jgi:phage major head subunit gpT-like protein
MLITPAALQAINVTFNSRFQDAYNAAIPQAAQLATVIPSMTKNNVYGWMLKIPRLREWVGDRVIQNIASQDYTLENKSYELTVGVDRDDIEDDQLGIYNMHIDTLGEQARMWPDDLIMQALIAGGSSLCFDGQFFFDTDHPTKIGDTTITQSNFSASTALSAANYFTLRANMRNFRGEDGRKLGVTPNLLVVPPALEKTAREILLADSNASGATNVARGTADLLVLNELTSDTEWYLMDTRRALKPLIFQERKAPQMVMLTEVNSENVFQRKEFIYGVDARGAAGYGLWFLAAKAAA